MTLSPKRAPPRPYDHEEVGPEHVKDGDHGLSSDRGPNGGHQTRTATRPASARPPSGTRTGA
jgi:hypothetical protein